MISVGTNIKEHISVQDSLALQRILESLLDFFSASVVSLHYNPAKLTGPLLRKPQLKEMAGRIHLLLNEVSKFLDLNIDIGSNLST